MGDKLAPPLLGNVIGDLEGNILIAEWTDEGGNPDSPQYIAPIHLHHTEDEAWYVLEGELGILMGEESVRVPAGSCVVVPKGTRHTYWNARAEPARYLLIMGPKTKALIDQIHARRRNWDEMKALFNEYEAELLGD